MKITALRRESAVYTPELGLSKDLAERAEKHLGYGGVAQEVAFIDAKTALLKVLQEVGIRPFNIEDVTKYKEKLLKKANRFWNLQSEYRRAGWDTTHIQGYKKPIPEFALHTAIQIREKEPRAEILIEELRYTRIVDPFMIVRLNRVDAYIEVWEEREFTGKRQV